MPTSRDQEEQDLKIDLMTIDIERMRRDIKRDNWRFALSAIVAAAAAVGAGVAIGNYFATRPAPQTVITLPPGTTITTPPTH